MNPHKPVTVAAVVLLIILTSCSTYVYFDRALPPEIVPAEKKNTIAFVNLFDYTKLTYTNENKIEVNIAGINKVIEGLGQAFSEDPDFSFQIFDTLVEGHASAGFVSDISLDSIRIICREANANLVLALEAFSTYFDQAIEVEEYDDGSKSRTAYFTLVVKAGFTLYNNAGSRVDRSMITESEMYLSRPALTGIYAIPPSLVKASGEINKLAMAAGKDYVNRFYPSSETVTRKLKTGKEFTEAVTLCKYGNWPEAIKALMPLTESTNPKISGKAAYNLSVVYEAEGNTSMSEYWLNRSYGH
jgi:hypothetical protein